MYSHTYDTIEALQLQIDEVTYYAIEVCNDGRMELPKKERWKILEIKNLLQTAKQLIDNTSIEQY